MRRVKESTGKALLRTAAFVLLSALLLLSVGCFDLSRVSHPGDEQEETARSKGEEIDKVDGKEEAAAVPSGHLKVHFIDVGQGDAILIQTPAKNILIDGGDRGSTALNYLRARGVKYLDLVIGTHPHADHIGGLIDVLQNIPVKEVIDPGVAHTTKTFEDYLTVIDRKEIKFTEGRAGLNRDLGGGVAMEVLHPSSPSSSHLNNASLVTKVSFGRVSFLFTGDAESEAEEQILQRGSPLGSTILKVGHHGSNSGTTQAFLDAIKPGAAVIMCGKGNTYGHPHLETLNRLREAGIDIYRTDMHGTIVVTTDGEEYWVNKQPLSYRGPPKERGSKSEGRVNLIYSALRNSSYRSGPVTANLVCALLSEWAA